MAFFEWSDALSVGLDSVDRQHRLLIGYINELSEAVEKGQGQFAVTRVLERLRQYTQVHFAYEETLFKIYKYEEADTHKHAHYAFVNVVQECERRHMKGESGVAADLLKYLKGWLADHILVEDKAYAAVLVKRGAR